MHQKSIRPGTVLGKAAAYIVMGVFEFMTVCPLVWLFLNSL